nr:glycosyltransferase N-terminal domain-containing protein [uncultured Desulfobulbus sp.]
MTLGWEERTLAKPLPGPVDIWIQSASGGESMLSGMVLTQLARLTKTNSPLTTLATAGTKQGIDSLHKIWGQLEPTSQEALKLTIRYFPLDAPNTMARAFAILRPRLAVIVETELWPGYLMAAKTAGVPVLLINGRMSEKSFRSYRFFRLFFKHYGPKRVLAISEADCTRFASLIGPERVTPLNNLKFDRIQPKALASAQHTNHPLVGEQCSFIVLGSIRQKEKAKILATIYAILQVSPDIVIGLFPKHVEWADDWIESLAQQGILAQKRSKIKNIAPNSSVIVWDTFGELAEAYQYADTAFVGGSLVPQGGQNFLEPLAFGVPTIIGPYWENFSWVGRDILNCGLVREVHDEVELSQLLLADLKRPSSRETTLTLVRDYLHTRQGGTKIVSQEILSILSSTKKRMHT